MRWLVTGSNGMLGRDLVALLRERGHEVTGVDRAELDITRADEVEGRLDGVDVVVNCAAYTAVDAAEADEAAAFRINAVGAAHLARAAAGARARLVQISTDYVFDGAATEPYHPDAPVAPASAYGRTKAAGEWAVRAADPGHLVVRTAWLYGAHGACFPRTIARVAAERGGLDVVEDQVGQPTWTRDLARYVEGLVTAGAPGGTYHGTSSGRTSWFAFARAVVAAAGLDPQIVRPVDSTQFSRPAPRPTYSVLAHEGAPAGLGIGPWAERWAQAAPEVLAAAPAR